MLLEFKDVSVDYGKVKALKGVSITVDEGEMVSIVGANGAGKTTTLKTIFGLLRPESGEIFFEGERIDGRPPKASSGAAWRSAWRDAGCSRS